MIFNSVTFIIFLVVVVTLYWTLSSSVKMWMLLIASCIFYGFWRWEYLSVMFVSAITDYYTAIAIGDTPVENKRRRKWLLAITLVVNLGLLFYFKYLYFLTENTNSLFHTLNIDAQLPLWHILLPFGISFYTFETISYTVDVYRGLIKPERKFINYALFVTFFPKLVAGPIQRASELLVQLKNRPAFQIDFLSEGLKRILYGLFLKVALADNISPMVDEGFSMSAAEMSAIDVWMLAFLFGFQIYFDFSAYSHIAVGAAKMMGISIPENFNYPYIASSFKDFWKRWHISLSSWIRDYLYLPLSGVKVVKTTGSGGIGEGLETTGKQSRNSALFLTWAIMGLWHGANWTFVVWGIYHALIIFIERQLKPLRSRFTFLNIKIIGWAFTLPLAMLSWIPFRATNLTDTFVMLKHVLNPVKYTFYTMRENNYIITAVLLISFLLCYYASNILEEKLKNSPALYFCVNCVKFTVIIIFVFTFLRPISQFIYFQF
ncbi:MAG: MBOAT family protein [Cyclobacteriaceae bacterium]|nr:MBOAT family protein [Cyclobacteriaceae bacterium]